MTNKQAWIYDLAFMTCLTLLSMIPVLGAWLC